LGAQALVFRDGQTRKQPVVGIAPGYERFGNFGLLVSIELANAADGTRSGLSGEEFRPDVER
jgi:hypothetical protein